MPILSAMMPQTYEVAKPVGLKEENRFALPAMLNGMGGTVVCTVGKKNLSLPVDEIDERISFVARLYISVIHYACVKRVLDKETLYGDVEVNGEHVYWNSLLSANLSTGEQAVYEFIQFRLAGKLHKYCLVWKNSKLAQIGTFE